MWLPLVREERHRKCFHSQLEGHALTYHLPVAIASPSSYRDPGLVRRSEECLDRYVGAVRIGGSVPRDSARTDRSRADQTETGCTSPTTQTRHRTPARIDCICQA